MRARLLFLSGREAGYIRNRMVLSALRTHFDVTVLTPNLQGTVCRSTVGLGRLMTRRGEHDACIAGFYGQPIAIALATLQRRPVILDAYVSTFDTLCADRQWFSPTSPMGWLARWLDSRGCQLAARVLTDTQADARYFVETFGVPAAKIDAVYVGCDESLFFPCDGPAPDRNRFEVFYYGAFLALHGTEVIVQAAGLLQDRPDIHFTLGGDGAHKRTVERTISDLALTNVHLPGWIPFEQLPARIASASLCLGGHFSTVPKAARVISTKTFQFLAMRRPTIVGDNPATREILVHGENAWIVPMGDPDALATAIRSLADDRRLREHIAAGGYQLFRERLTVRALAHELKRSVVAAL